MRRMHKKTLSVLLAALLLLPVSFLPVYAQEQDHDYCKMSNAVFSYPSLCQHTFVTLIGNEFRYISETHHSCYEVELHGCTKCGFTYTEDVTLLYTEKHELEVVENFEEDENGELIYYGICADCKERGYTTP